MSSSSRLRIAVVAIILTVGGALLYFSGVFGLKSDPISESDDPADPRLTFETPYRNVRPEVAYVGDSACAPCHKDLCESFHLHPMGRSASMWKDVRRVESFDQSAGTAFTSTDGSRYRVEEKDGRLWQTEILTGANGLALEELPAEASIVFGSGQQARSYASVRDGSVWQTGVTWYNSRHRWDLSPGFLPGMNAQRVVSENCFFCHVDRVELVSGTTSRFQEPLFPRQASIGCERCHGPGALHVQERTNGQVAAGLDTSIVNPRRLQPDLRDAICQQCHLQGEYQLARRGRNIFDFRPGLPLESVISVFVKSTEGAEAAQFVGHVKQMEVSRCATASNGKMGCISCHDPHVDPAPQLRQEKFRQACLQCHAESGCSLPLGKRQANKDNCAGCHMPHRGSDIVHVAVTDHRILRRPLPKKSNLQPAMDELPINFFHAKSRFAPPREEQERDLGIALAHIVWVNHSNGVPNPDLADAALERLETSTGRFPRDAVAFEALAQVLAATGKPNEALAAAESALALGPRRETALQNAAMIALELGQLDKARDLTGRAIQVNPGNPMGRLVRGMVLVEAQEWAEAANVLRAGLRDMPQNPTARVALAVCLQKLGNKADAQAELERAVAITPGKANGLRDLFAQKVR